MKRALLALADGTVYEGTSFGAEGETVGEVVFNTSMTGYQEILTDPSYKGQMVAMTYTEIGNYGLNEEDFESSGIQVEGFIVKAACATPSNWRASKSLHQGLAEAGVVGIEGVDTRALTKRLRDFGAMMGVISTVDLDPQSLVAKAKSAPSIESRDLVAEVTCKAPYRWTVGDWTLGQGYQTPRQPGKYRVVAYDFGIKYNILRLLTQAGCDVTVVPAATKAEEVLALDPHGVFLSNGPGDPAVMGYAVDEIKKLLGKKPIFGICLGNQLLGRALGAQTRKLKFGHHGGNQPVMDLSTRKVEITSQNHNFVVDLDTLKAAAGDSVEVTHVNLNDNTVEGMRHREVPMFSVQYHPEASPGPHDAAYLFKRFTDLMDMVK